MRFKKQLELIKQYYELFNQLYSEYIHGRETVYAIERLVELLAQSILDLAAMLASLEKKKPSTYKGLAEYLTNKLGLDHKHSEFLKGLAGFRNLLIHGYAHIIRDIEEEAFKNVKELTPAIIQVIEEKLPSDPCMDDVVDKIRIVASKWDNIEYIVLFGSVAREGCGNDVDLAVKGRFRSGIELGRFLVDLADELGLPLDKVDIVLIDSAPIGLLKTIIDEGVIIYGDNEEAREDLYRKYLKVLDSVDEEKAIEKKIKMYKRLLTK